MGSRHILTLLASAAVALAWIAGAVVMAVRRRRQPRAGAPGAQPARWRARLLGMVSIVAAILVLATCALVTVLTMLAWARGTWSPRRDPRLAGLVLAALALTAQVAAWRLVGWGLT